MHFELIDLAISLCLLLGAILYTSVGHAGASIYIAITIDTYSSVDNIVSHNASVGGSFTYTPDFDPYATAWTSSALPSGLSLNSTTGVISGTPTVSGTISIILSSIGPKGQSSAVLTLAVSVYNPTTLTLTAYEDVAWTNSPNWGPFGTWSAAGMPSWMSINSSTGVLSGTPDALGSYTITRTSGSSHQTINLTTTTYVPAPLLLVASYEFGASPNSLKDSTGSADLTATGTAPVVVGGVATFAADTAYLTGSPAAFPAGLDDRTIVVRCTPSSDNEDVDEVLFGYGKNATAKMCLLWIHNAGGYNYWQGSNAEGVGGGTTRVVYDTPVSVALSIGTLAGTTTWTVFVKSGGTWAVAGTTTALTTNTDVGTGSEIWVGGDNPDTGEGAQYIGTIDYIHLYSGAMGLGDLATNE